MILRDKESTKYKIGVSKDVDRRVKELSNSLNLNIEISFSYPVIQSYKLESLLHIRFKEKNAFGEWFYLSDSDIKIIKSYVIKNSSTIGDLKISDMEAASEVGSEVGCY
jgi:hypothetical protein